MQKNEIPNGAELFLEANPVNPEDSTSHEARGKWTELPTAKVAGARDRQQKKDQ